jgi:hypothetical protein
VPVATNVGTKMEVNGSAQTCHGSATGVKFSPALTAMVSGFQVVSVIPAAMAAASMTDRELQMTVFDAMMGIQSGLFIRTGQAHVAAQVDVLMSMEVATVIIGPASASAITIPVTCWSIALFHADRVGIGMPALTAIITRLQGASATPAVQAAAIITTQQLQITVSLVLTEVQSILFIAMGQAGARPKHDAFCMPYDACHASIPATSLNFSCLFSVRYLLLILSSWTVASTGVVCVLLRWRAEKKNDRSLLHQNIIMNVCILKIK